MAGSELAFSPILVYNGNLNELLTFNTSGFPMYSPDEEVTDKNGVFIQDNLLSLKTMETGSTGSTLEFSLPAEDSKAPFLAVEKFVDFENKTYIIKEIKDIHEGLEWRVEVYAERWWYAWTQNGTTIDLGYDGYDAPSAINEVVSYWMTDDIVWSQGDVEGDGIYAMDNSMGISTMERLKTVEGIWGGYLIIDINTKKVHLLKDPGNDHGIVFNYDHDVAAIRRTVDSSDMVTRAILVREDGTIITQFQGKSYVYNFTWTNRIYDGVLTFKNNMYETTAYNIARNKLKELSRPKISYEISLASLNSPNHSYKDFAILDKVSVHDENFNRIVKARIVELEIDYLEPYRSRMVLGNRLSNLALETKYETTVPEGLIPPQDPDPKLEFSLESFGYMNGDLPRSKIQVNWNMSLTYWTGLLIELDDGTVYEATASNYVYIIDNLRPGTVVWVSLMPTNGNIRDKWTDPKKIVTVGP